MVFETKRCEVIIQERKIVFFKNDHIYIAFGSGHAGTTYVTGEFTTKHEACC